MVEWCEEMTAVFVTMARAAQGLAVHCDDPPCPRPWDGAPGSPLAGQVIEGIGVQALQGPPERRFR
jgi:hypothetical protein